jgi:RNA polymerase sigma factor (sigma-70 family)
MCVALGADHLADDCMSEARIAVWRCAEQYDPAAGTTLRQYAGRRVHGAVVDALRSWGHLSRRLENVQVFSLDERPDIEEDFDSWTPKALSCDPDVNADVLHARSIALKCLAVLNERQRRAVEMYFGEDLLLCEIGVKMGVNKQRVWQIIQDSLAKMRNSVAVWGT